MLNLSLQKLKLIAKNGGIKGYKSMYKDKLLSKLNASEPIKDVYVQSDKLLLADVFANFRNKCIERYELHTTHFLSAAGLTWQKCLKKKEIGLELLTDINMLLMIKKNKLEVEYVMLQQIIKIWKTMIIIKIHHI